MTSSVGPPVLEGQAHGMLFGFVARKDDDLRGQTQLAWEEPPHQHLAQGARSPGDQIAYRRDKVDDVLSHDIAFPYREIPCPASRDTAANHAALGQSRFEFALHAKRILARF